MIAIIMVVLLLSIGAYVFSSIALGKIFVKLGEQAWKGWIPIVNIITLFELGRYSALWVLGLFIPAANLVALVIFIMAVNNVNRRLGHGGGFTLLCLDRRARVRQVRRHRLDAGDRCDRVRSVHPGDPAVDDAGGIRAGGPERHDADAAGTSSASAFDASAGSASACGAFNCGASAGRAAPAPGPSHRGSGDRTPRTAGRARSAHRAAAVLRERPARSVNWFGPAGVLGTGCAPGSAGTAGRLCAARTSVLAGARRRIRR